MSALIIYNIHLIFALDDSIMANIDRLNQFFSMGCMITTNLNLNQNYGCVKEYIQTVST